MSEQAYPSLNRIAQSWADIKVKVALQDGPLLETIDVADISHESIVEVGEQRGPGSRVTARSTGKLSDSAKMTLYAPAMDRFEAALADLAPKEGDEYRISLVHFDIIVLHTPPRATDIRSIEILGVRLLGRSEAYSDGSADVDKADATLSVARIVKVINGKRIVLL